MGDENPSTMLFYESEYLGSESVGLPARRFISYPLIVLVFLLKMVARVIYFLDFGQQIS